MLQKEGLVHQSDQPVLNSRTWIKKLTMILASVLLLTMFGLGGYWLGARRQQLSPSNLLTKPESSQLPSVTPIQKLSSTPTTATDSTAGWETYRDPQGFFSVKYPLDPHIKVQHMKGSSPRELITNVVIQRSFEPGSQLDSIGTFYLSLSVIDNVNHVTAAELRQSILQSPCADTLKPYRNGAIDGLYYVDCSRSSINGLYHQQTILHTVEDKIYEFTFNTEGEPISDDTKTFIDQIISTFTPNPQ
jgi:hypothetical protein